MMKDLIITRVDEKQASDSGMAFVLIMLILGFWTKSTVLFEVAIPVLLINMIFPKLFSPWAVIWLSLANVMGYFVSKVFLSLLFIFMVIPMGLIRRISGADSLMLKDNKRGKKSAFIDRDHTFSFKDIENPY